MSASQRRAGSTTGRVIGPAARGAAAVLVALACVAVGAPAALAAPPTISYTLTGSPGQADWFLGPVTVKWAEAGETATSGCETQTLTTDTGSTKVTCTASNAEGDTALTTKAIKIDQTPPAGVVAVPVRPPDHPPWYTAPVAIGWSGSDATSGIATCTAVTYGGPDGPSVAPAGTCRDNAGNTSAAVAFGLAYDATPPALSDLAATVTGVTADVRWAAAPDVQQVSVVRRPGDGSAVARTVADGAPPTVHEVADGPLAAGIAYTWAVTVRDAAGNATTASTTATVPPPVTQQSTPPGKKKAAKKKTRLPTLRWRARPGAKYYNFQLFRNGHKILSAWPTRAHYTLRATWHYRGQRHRLVAGGHYRWYVWAGYGPRSRHRYGATPIRGTVKIP